MCFIASINTKKQYAPYDITVYKICHIEDNCAISLYFYFKYKIGKLNEPVELHYTTTAYKDIIICNGYHSYRKILSNLKLDTFVTFIRRNKAVSIHPRVIAKFIIPKGTAFYENEQGEIVSENIIYTGSYYAY